MIVARPRVRRAALGLAAALLVPLAGCGGDDGTDRSTVVGALADDVAVPAFVELADLAGDLFDSTVVLCAAPSSASVADARVQVARTRASWRRSEAVWVGPVMDRRSWSLIDWPVAPGDIEVMLADPSIGPLDAEFLSSSIGAPLRGLGAIEHVLFAAGDGTATALADARRCQYLQGLTRVVADEASAVLSAWMTDDDGVPFRDELAGQTGATDSIDALVNSMLTRLEGSVNRELGKAVGAGTEPADVSGIVEGPGGFGVADQVARADGIRTVLLGPDGTSGLSPLLDTDLRTRLATAFDALDTALTAITPPLLGAITNDTARVRAAYAAYADLRVIVSTELISALGITVSFSDADGDSAG